MRALFLCMLTGCGPTTFKHAYFTTKCGMTMYGHVVTGEYTPELDLEELQDSEDLAVEYGLVDCASLKGYAIWVHDDAWNEWFDTAKDGGSTPDWRRAATTWCNDLSPRVEMSRPYPHSLMHEAHHISQRCLAPWPIDPDQDASHADWTRSGAAALVQKVEFILQTKHWAKHNPDDPYGAPRP